MNTILTRTSAIAEAAAASPRHNKAISATQVVARTRRRTPLLLIIAAAIAAALPLMGATPAQAATYRDPTPGAGSISTQAATYRDPTPGAGSISTLAASGCRAAPYRFHFEGYGSIAFPEDPTGQWNATTTPVLKTTTECRDINVKNTTKGKIVVCVMFGKTGRTCNYRTTIAAGTWANAATNVKDGTYFRMRLGILVNTPGYAGGATGYADF